MLQPSASQQLYLCARERGRRGQLWRALTGQQRHLLALADTGAMGTLNSRTYAGIETVPIRCIQGSQGRSQDFDLDFNPLQDRTQVRWLSVAQAQLGGRSLPPVKLVQVKGLYFVQDGHHRISVARALGQQDIDAEVSVWGVTGLLDREESFTSEEKGIEGLSKKARDRSTRLQQRLLLTLRDHVIAAGMTLKVLNWRCRSGSKDLAKALR